MLKVLGVDITQVDTTAAHGLGDQFLDNQTGNLYVYIQANGAVGQYVPVKVAASYDCPPSGNGGHAFAIPQVAIADNSYGWALLRGSGSAQVATGVTAGNPLSRVTDANGDLKAVVAVDEATTTVHAAGSLSTYAVAITNESSGVSTVQIF